MTWPVLHDPPPRHAGPDATLVAADALEELGHWPVGSAATVVFPDMLSETVELSDGEAYRYGDGDGTGFPAPAVFQSQPASGDGSSGYDGGGYGEEGDEAGDGRSQLPFHYRAMVRLTNIRSRVHQPFRDSLLTQT